MSGRAPGQTTRPGEHWMTVHEVAGELRVSPMSVYRLVHGLEIRAVRFGRSYRIAERDLDAYIARAERVLWDDEDES